MKVEGSHTLAAARELVFQTLVDPARVARLLPGCEKLEPAGADSFKVKMKLGLAALSGAYEGTVQVTEKQPPERVRLSVASRGPWGFAEGDGTLTLKEQDGKTVMSYAGELKVGGMIASIGQRFLDGAARMVIGQFFQNLEREVGGG